MNLLTCSLCSVEELVESVDVVLADNGLIVVEEEGVILCAGICEELILAVYVDGSGVNRAGGVDFLNICFNSSAFFTDINWLV